MGQYRNGTNMLVNEAKLCQTVDEKLQETYCVGRSFGQMRRSSKAKKEVEG